MTSDGVVDLLESQSVTYEPWLDISSRDALRESLNDGVANAITRHAIKASAASHVRRNIYDLRRAGWQVLCPLRRNSIVIDFGCGLGALSRSIARNVGSVIGIDACYERLMINAAVNREQRVENICLLAGNHEILSDIKEDSIDGFVLNGVLEWIPEQITGDPYKVQLDFLRQCRRILKPDGWLYLGIENRWGFRYFLGKRDEHTQLRFSNLLPRWMATGYSHIARGKPYRTFTYGPSATRLMLTRAGFHYTTAYAPLPDYRDFDTLVPLDGQPSPAAAVAKHLGISKPWKRSIVESRAFVRRYLPCLSIVGTSEAAPTPPWLVDLGNQQRRILKYYVKHDQASIWYCRSDAEIRIRDVALSSEAEEKLERIRRLSDALQNSHWCPRALQDWSVAESCGFVWADRKLVDGCSFEELSQNERDRSLDSLFRELRAIHRAAEHVAWRVLTLGNLFDDIAPNADRDLPAQLLLRIRAIISHLEQSCRGKPILMHGDSKAANAIVSGEEVHLIDWEWSRVVANVGYDVLKFAWSGTEDPNEPSFRGDDTVVEGCLDDGLARQYFSEVHPHTEWKDAVLVYWVTRLARTIGLFRYGGMPKDWHDHVFEPWTKSMCRAAHL